MKKISEMTNEELERRALELAEKEHRRKTIKARLRLIEVGIIAVIILIGIVVIKAVMR